jgi:divalent metal cation (Fe/Co/Zn/Cd) transporter
MKAYGEIDTRTFLGFIVAIHVLFSAFFLIKTAFRYLLTPESKASFLILLMLIVSFIFSLFISKFYDHAPKVGG